MRAVPWEAIDEAALKGRRKSELAINRSTSPAFPTHPHTGTHTIPQFILYLTLWLKINPTARSTPSCFLVCLFKCIEVGFQCSLAMHHSDRWPNCIPMWVSWYMGYTTLILLYSISFCLYNLFIISPNKIICFHSISNSVFSHFSIAETPAKKGAPPIPQKRSKSFELCMNSKRRTISHR